MLSKHPVRRCAPCDRDWPNTATYNLCPCCQLCTWATTSDELPSSTAARNDAARYKKIRDFDAKADADHAAAQDRWVADMEAVLALTPSIPDPTPTAPKNYGLAGGTTNWEGDNA